MSDELPKGWASAHVSEVIENFQPGFASGEKNVEGGVSHLRMNNIGLDGKLVLDLVRTVPEKLAKSRHDLSHGDVLVCTTNSGTLVGKCAYFDLPGRYAFSNHLTRLRPKRDVVDGRFLRWNLWLHWKRGTYDDKCKHWVNQSTLPKDALLEDEVVVPPLAEQQRIVAKLETLLGKVGASQQRLAKIPVLLKRFRQSVLAAACSGRLTADWREENRTDDADGNSDLPQSWKSVKFGELISDGPQNGLYKPASFYGDCTLIVRIDAFYDGTIAAWGELKRVRLTDKECSQYALRNDDILVNRVNSPKFLGKCALVRKLKEPCVYESNMMRLRLNTARILPDYAIQYLQSLPGLAELRKNAKHAVNQSSINQEDVKSAMFNLPPLPEQQEIVRRIERLFTLADQLEERLAKARAYVDKLTPSLLARAFAGKLVPQDPTDEPAEKLLERIRNAEPPATQKAPKKKRATSLKSA